MQASTALAELASMAALQPVVVTNVDDLPSSAVADGGVLALFTIGETPFTQEQREAIVQSWRSRKLGILGIHAATDACHRWPEYGEMLGARFDGHPWTCSVQVDVADGDHPSTSHLPDPWPWHDEVYLFSELRPDAQVLLRLEPEQLDMSAPGARVPPCGLPLAWCIDGKGATFYTALGHFHGAWENPVYLRHIAGGLSWLQDRRQLSQRAY